MRHQLFSLLAMLMLSMGAYSQVEVSTQGVLGVEPGTAVVVTDNKLNYITVQKSSQQPLGFVDVKNENIVSLKVDHRSMQYSEKYRADVTLEVKSYTVNNNGVLDMTLLEQIKLSVEHDPNSTGSSELMEHSYQVFVQGAGQRVEVTVVEINELLGVVPGDFLSNLLLEAEIRTTRDYDFDASAYVQGIGNDYNTVTYSHMPDLSFYWSYMEGASAYDLEWMWLDDNDGEGGNVHPKNLHWRFEGSSNRVRLTQNWYDIPFLFNQGYIVYRVRAVHEPIGGGDVEYGPWSLLDNEPLNSYSSNSLAYLTDGQHPDLINYVGQQAHLHVPEDHDKKSWQQVSTYAENGMRKDVVSYYDGSMRSRQMVTRMNTNDEAIVGETVYDHQGRAAVQILPVPAEDDDLRYYENFNRNLSGFPYSKLDFDIDNGVACNKPIIGKLAGTSGASKYYSEYNSDQRGYNAYIPNANGYPFVVTEYQPDNTGRIRRQSGVGETHKLGSGHETKYFYGTPSQVELDRLFGSEVGYASHYKKNVVVDANNQASVSYLDPAGRVIATALVGDVPDNLQEVSPDGHDVVEEYTQYNEKVGNSLEVSKDIIVVGDDVSYTFKYSLDPAEYSLTCSSTDICYDGAYKLSIYLFDECGVDRLPQSVKGVSIGANAPIGECTDSGIEFESTEAIQLSTGSYKLVKRLEVDENKLQLYWNNYLNNSSCVESFSTFMEREEFSIDPEGCAIDCAKCKESLGDESTFIENGGTAEGYRQAMLECNSICDEETSYCENLLEQLMMDVSPSGQYGNVGSNQTASTDVNSVFFDNRWKSVSYTDRSPSHLDILVPVINGYPEYDNNAVTQQLYGQTYINPKDIKYLSDFLDLWEDEWAFSLVSLHPEYCYYENCSKYDKGPEEAHDVLFFNTDSYADAVANGFISTRDPGNWNETDKRVILNSDNYFVAIGGAVGAGSIYYNDMVEWITNYKDDGNGGYLSLYQIAAMSVLCPNFYNMDINNIDMACMDLDDLVTTEQKNAFWFYIKTQYISKKQEVQFKSLEEACSASVVVPSGKVKRYQTSDDLDLGNGVTMADNEESAKEQMIKKSRYLIYDETGMCPAAFDMTLLLNGLINDHREAWVEVNVDLSTSNYLTPTLYNLFNSQLSPSAGNQFQPYTISTFRSSANLRIQIENAHHGAVGDLTIQNLFNYQNGSTSYISKIIGMTAFYEVDPGLFEFDVEVEVKTVDPVSGDEIVDFVWLKGQSVGLNFGGCEGEINYCELDAAGISFRNILADLLSSGDFNNSNVALDGSNNTNLYYFSTDLKRTVQGCAYNYKWVNTGASSGKFVPLNASNPAAYDMIIELDGFSFNASSQYELTGLIPLDNSNGQSNFKAWVKITTNGVSTEHSYLGSIHDGASTPTLIEISECGKGALCSGKYENVGKAIDYLFNALAVDASHMTGVAPANPITFSGYCGYSSVLRDAIDPNDTQKGSEVYTPNASSTVCDYKLVIQNSSGNAVNFIQIHPTASSFPASLYNSIDRFINFEITGYDMSATPQEVHFTVVGVDDNTPSSTFYYFEGSSGIMFNTCDDCSDGVLVNETFGRDGQSYTLAGEIPLTLLSPDENQFNGQDQYDITASGHDNVPNVADRNEPGTGQVLVIGQMSSVNYHPVWLKGGVNVFKETEYVFELYHQTVGDIANTGKVKFEISSASGTVLESQEFDLILPEPWTKKTLNWFSGNYEGPVVLTISTGMWDSNAKVVMIDDIRFYKNGCFELNQPLEEGPTYTYDNDCIDELEWVEEFNATLAYETYIEDLRTDFRNNYITSMFSDMEESLSLVHHEKEHHYTLYYYDQAGNLRRTVPPKGVSIISEPSVLAAVKHTRDKGLTADERTAYTNHTLKSTYEYNSLNQLVKQHTPDGGTSRFWYDYLGRLVVSQNAKQAENKLYSYTIYDDLGRIKEVGQLNSNTQMTQVIAGSPLQQGAEFTALQHWINDAINTATEVTKTFYNEVCTLSTGALTQNHIRNRVSYVAIDMENDGQYDHITAYNYDIHGNVVDVYHENNYLYNQIKSTGANYDLRPQTHINYDFDLVSGNVKQVSYQPGKNDQFLHAYTYDADNRLIEAKTSDMGYYWDVDAEYIYYKHGPLARVELGDNKVQGLDYAYNMMGWIKTVNSEMLVSDEDMGLDGYQGGVYSYNGSSANPHATMPADVFGFSLGYFDGDYQKISPETGSHSRKNFAHDKSGVSHKALYNGNISWMSTAYDANGLGDTKPRLSAYAYDQLNRIKGMESYGVQLGEWKTTHNNEYKTHYEYDAMGNIQELVRFDASGNLMDELNYEYYDPDCNEGDNNRLMAVHDGPSTPSIDYDFEDYSEYTYDAIGNLTSDKGEKIDKIEWTVSGKVKSVSKKGQLIRFFYDAMGNRVNKVVSEMETWDAYKATWYARDASGNTMAVYSSEHNDVNNPDLVLSELNIFGSDRVGVLKVDKKVALLNNLTNDVKVRTRGYKHFELKNHLGNVIATVSDRLISKSSDALDFDGGDKITVPNHSYLQVTGDLTLEFWVKPESFSSRKNIINKSYSAEYAVTQETDGKLNFYYGIGSGYQGVRTINKLALNKWNHVAIVRDFGQSKVSIYLNGKLDRTVSTTYTSSATSTNDVSIGHGYAGYYDGLIDDVRIWKSARSASQVKRNMHTNLNGSESNLVAYYDFNNITGQVVHCKTTSTLNGVFGTSTSAETTDPSVVSNVAPILAGFSAEVVTYADYYPFGMMMNERFSTDHRYGFNGMEKDDELKGSGNSYDFGARIYDPRIGRWLACDPLAAKYLDLSPYNFALNSPILFNDPDGKDAKVTVKRNSNGTGTIIISSTIYITGEGATEQKAQILNNKSSQMFKSGTSKDANGIEWTVEFDIEFKYIKDVSTITLQKHENVLEGSRKVNRAYVHTGKVERDIQHSKPDAQGFVETKSVSYYTTGQVGKLPYIEMAAYTGGQFSTIHETLHFLGLKDRYTDNAQGLSIPHKGWKGDIMASRYGTGIKKSKITQTHYDNYVKYFSGLEDGDYHLNQFIDMKTTKMSYKKNISTGDQKDFKYEEVEFDSSTTKKY